MLISLVPYAWKSQAYMFKYDTVHGRMRKADIYAEDENTLSFGQKKVAVSYITSLGLNVRFLCSVVRVLLLRSFVIWIGLVCS